MRHKSMLIRVAALLLAIIFVVPANVYADSLSQLQPRESYYLDYYLAYCYPMGAGRVNVYFEVAGNARMTDIGVLSIELYESVNNQDWYWVRTYHHDSYPGMLGHDSSAHAGHVTYYGIPGRYYKAYVGIWAGQNSNGDSRYFWTNPKQA